MTDIILLFALFLFAVALAVGVGYWMRKATAEARIGSAEKEANKSVKSSR